MHTIGIVGFAWNSLDMFAPPGKHAEIYDKMKDAVAKVDDKANPGLREQFEIAMERFVPGKAGSPGSEFISFPGFLSGPSEYTLLLEFGSKCANCATQTRLSPASGTPPSL